jgi:hypothetical protein
VDISGLFWRKSALNAANCPPGLLALRNGRLSFTTATSIEFDEPATAISGALSVWGSLVLTVNTRKYVFLSTVGQFTGPFSKTQQQAINAASREKSLRTLAEWPGILSAAGARVRAPKHNYRPWILGTIAGLLAAGAITLILLNGGF